ncbi:hypothetical protein TL16_g12934 [Triparma laevis f. inornata]|uniref:beta-galactosidase n=1 Tax=Triparma laevis f. inornata TaxID=1714386 RepID=A0A9W7EXY3_9STRA|nr:hypothetical protein TL16_g12934 [Triparma laevis f. inornata]
MPTNATYSQLLFFTLTSLLVSAYIFLLKQYETYLTETHFFYYESYLLNALLDQLAYDYQKASANYSINVNLLFVLHVTYAILAALILRSFARAFMPKEDWENPEVTQRRRLPMRSSSMRYSTEARDARNQATQVPLCTEFTKNVVLLDSETAWRFMYTEDPAEAKFLVWGKEHDPAKYCNVPVPSNWQLSTPHDIPIYTNVKYPFPATPPYLPRHNPTGCYQRKFTLPKTWKGGEFSILFHGAGSAYYAYVNGGLVGYSQDSCLPAEFDVTEQLKKGKNGEHTLEVVCIRWSDGSFLEDQDHWWLSGIARSVELIHKPETADMVDFSTQADMNGHFSTSVLLKNKGSGRKTKKIDVKLYADVQTSLDGSYKQGDEVFRGSASVDPKEKNVVISGFVQKPKLWTAETPDLYTCVVTTEDAKGNVLQAESTRVGFKTVEITSKGVFMVNSKAITVAGVNRHDHHPDTGKTMTIATFLEDITILKQNNFNAIRTCHYPNSTEFYKLCDYLGMYVCDEANIEVHGMQPMGKLASDPYWTEAFCERITRMAQRDRNHACITTWSLGNESGRGCCLTEARARLRAIDPSRPIMYESGGDLIQGTGRTELTDIICPMYPPVDLTNELGTRADEDRPVILCEFTHAMGNSNGNLHLYWDLFWDESKPRIQGGYVWDMIDQGLRKIDPKTKKEFWAYGGDFGDVINDKQFCINGLWFPDRKPHPAVAECKRLMQPVKFDLHSDAVIEGNSSTAPEVSLKVKNRYSFADLSHLALNYTVTCDASDAPLSTGSTSLSDFVTLTLKGCEPSTLVNLPLSVGRVWLNVSAVLKKGCEWAPKDHVIAAAQFEVELKIEGVVEGGGESRLQSPGILRKFTMGTMTGAKTGGLVTSGNPEADLTVSEDTAKKVFNFDIDARKSSVVIDKQTGSLTHLVTPSGKNVLHKTTTSRENVSLNVIRAATDNDRGGAQMLMEFVLPPAAVNVVGSILGTDLFSHEYHWARSGLAARTPPTSVCKSITVDDLALKNQTANYIETQCKTSVLKTDGGEVIECEIFYRIYRNGDVQVRCAVDPKTMRKELKSLPRLGLSLALDPSLFNITYLGQGGGDVLGENYPDRNTCADYGVYSTSPKEMHVDYIVPGENGARGGCEWAAFADQEGAGLLIRSDSLQAGEKSSFSFSASLYSIAELESAEHTYDLPNKGHGTDPIYVNIDHKIMGVAGDCSWLPCVYDDYLVNPKEKYSFAFWMCPLAKGQSPLAQSKRPVGI